MLFSKYWKSKEKGQGMDPVSQTQMIANVIGRVLGAAVGSLIGAFFIQLGTRIVARYKPGYGCAYKAALLAYLAFLGFELLVGFVFRAMGRIDSPLEVLVTLPLGFLIQSFVYGFLIEDDEGNPLGFGRGILVSLFQVVVGVILIAILVLISLAIAGVL